MSGDADEIILEVEGIPITCKRQQLTKNSDYFKAMLEGSFIESSKKSIKLEGVDLRAMNIVLQLLSDDSLIVNTEDILPVLETVCMLQFLKLKEKCIERIRELLNPDNSLKIWLVCEQLDVKPLYLQAKTMSLMEFPIVRLSECVLSLTLQQLCLYLGHRHLQCTSEIDVLETALKWWYENDGNYEQNSQEVLLKLLSCLDFSRLSQSEVRQIKIYPDISDHPEIIEILDFIADKKTNCESIFDSSEVKENPSQSTSLIEMASYLLNSKPRLYPEYPCIVVEDVNTESIENELSEESHYEIHNRAFRRIYPLSSDRNPKQTVIFFNFRQRTLSKLTSLDASNYARLDGFKLVGYKEYIFMFGGEYRIGKGDWNYNFWVYDTIRERWQRRSVLPYPRRHFQYCICDGILYIVGGTGCYRVIQEKLFWYNFKEDRWSKEIMLPCQGRQIKSLSFKNKLFILCVNNKCGYLFETSSTWHKFNIHDPDNVIPAFNENFAAFSYNNRIYIKGSNLIELELKDEKMLWVVLNKPLDIQPYDDMEAVLCSNILYTIYKRKTEESKILIHFEKFDVVTHEISKFSNDITKNSVIKIEGNPHLLTDKLELFKFQHYSLNEENNLVHDISF